MILFLAVSFVILNILDVVTTRRILALGGYEANPISRVLMKFNLFLPVKIIITTILASDIISNQNQTNGLILCGIISLFVINNYYQLYMYNKEVQE